MPVPGDIVRVRILEDEQALVERVEPRSFTLERRSAAGRAKTMAANVDLIVTVTALANPPPRFVTLDQLLAFAEVEEVAAAVVLTKPDLSDPVQSQVLAKLYRDLGYPTAVINPKTNENVDTLRDLICDRRALLVGNSGVGKSTIFRALGGEATVGDVRGAAWEGRRRPRGGSTESARASLSTAPASTSSGSEPSRRAT